MQSFHLTRRSGERGSCQWVRHGIWCCSWVNRVLCSEYCLGCLATIYMTMMSGTELNYVRVHTSFRCSKQNILPQHAVLTFLIWSLENELDCHEQRCTGTRGTTVVAPAHSLSTSDEETKSGVLADAGDLEPRSRLNPKLYSGSSSMLPSSRGDSEWEEVLIGVQVHIRGGVRVGEM